MTTLDRSFQCSQCGQTKTPDSPYTTGYGTNAHGDKICYACCAVNDRRQMKETGKATLYLTGRNGEWSVSNWPGTLTIPARVSIGRHNIAGKRYDARFTLDGKRWHGVTYGDNTQICHCKALKG